jgi:MFS family permease
VTYDTAAPWCARAQALAPAGRGGAMVRRGTPLSSPSKGTSTDVQPWTLGHYHTLGALFLAYAVGMFAKGTMSLAIFGMSKDTALGFSAADISSLLALGSAGYTAGKLVGGPVSDALGGKSTLFSMLAVMGGAKLLMGRLSSLGAMKLGWVIARGAHAFLWMGVMLVVRPWFMGNSSALSVLTSSSRVGAFGGSVLGGLVLAGSAGWRGLSRMTAAITLGTAALVLTLRNRPPECDSDVSAASSLANATMTNVTTDGNSQVEKTIDAGRKMSLGRALRIAFTSPKLLAVYGSTALITPTFDLTTLLPMYLDSLGMVRAVVVIVTGTAVHT